MTLPFFDEVTPDTLDTLERLACDCERQMASGGKDWPGKPCRQRLDLFLATPPSVVLRLVALARETLRRAETPSSD
jgi:hypothetical protein